MTPCSYRQELICYVSGRSTSKQAFQVVQATAYDLLIVCQTVSDTVAGQLIFKARKMNEYVLALALSQPGHERILPVELFEVQPGDPDRLRRVVTHLLQQADSMKRLADRPRLCHQITPAWE
jgi:hypothetical protein